MFIKSQTINKNKLSLFQKYEKHQLVPVSEVTLRKHFARSSNFRSFFAFLKPKTFITSCVYSYLKVFSLNPKPYAFNQYILHAKKFKSTHIDRTLGGNYSEHIFSSQVLINLLLVKSVRFVGKLSYLLFKHRIHNYTTAKKSSPLTVLNSVRVLPPVDDFRVAQPSGKLQVKLPNTQTISTYNWKSIN